MAKLDVVQMSSEELMAEMKRIVAKWVNTKEGIYLSGISRELSARGIAIHFFADRLTK